MPPKRRTSTPRAAQRQQATLSFGGKSKVTKPTSPRNAKSKKDPEQFEELLATSIKNDPTSEIEEPTTAEKAITEQVKAEVATLEDPLQTTTSKTEDVLGGRAAQSEVGATGGKGSGWIGDEESRARKMTTAQVNKYWRAKEAERMAPRVHQQDLSTHEKILREWDMSGQYGVSSANGCLSRIRC
jgi:DNA polymerase delta subunit 4